MALRLKTSTPTPNSTIPMLSSPSKVGPKSASPPPSARVVKPSIPQALGVILLTNCSGRHVFQVKEAAAQDAEDEHQGRPQIGDLGRRAGQRR